jgi:hypothetical protein
MGSPGKQQLMSLGEQLLSLFEVEQFEGDASKRGKFF